MLLQLASRRALTWQQCRRYSSNVGTAASDSDRKAQWKRTAKSSTFVDTLSIQIKGGQGGDGCIAFSRAKYLPYGPPSGASGGKGGDVYIEASRGLSSLARIANSHVADRGQHGTSEWQVGKKGKDRVIRVPIGTVVTVCTQDPEEEVDVQAQEYDRELKRKYRVAFMRNRRAFTPSPSQEESGDPFDKRAQRDAVWRHYPGGANTHAYSTKEEEETDFSEKDIAEQEALSEANSDIAGTMANFRESERRLAFTLLSEEIQTSKETHWRHSQWGVNDVEEGWSVDLIEESSAPLLIAAGGSGGLGNAFFASSSNKSPKLSTKGRTGQAATVHLEWKFKGDVGLIGLPNAGKSTFLKSVCETGNDVRVGSYAFTTLSPNVGVVRLSETGLLGVRSQTAIEESGERRLIAGLDVEREEEEEREKGMREDRGDDVMRFTLQDLPGLVEGASDNRGLGHSFLKHVERCLALYYVVDMHSTPWEDMRLVHDELESYQSGLSAKVRGVIANKCDVLDPEDREKLQVLREKAAELHGDRVKVYNVSAKHRQGVERVAREMANVVWQEQQDHHL